MSDPMTTPPLDLPALRAKLRITKVTDNAEVLALLDRLEAAEKKVAAVIDWCDTNQHPFHPSEGAVGFSRQDWALDDAARRVRTMLTTPETETTP